MLGGVLRDSGGSHHAVLEVLTDHLEVIWGALVAFVVVVLLIGMGGVLFLADVFNPVQLL